MAKRGRPPNPEARENFLAAALACFAERGFHGTSVPQVARAAGMAAGSLYHYFPSKEALVNALFRNWKEAIAARVMEQFPPMAPPREQFRTMWHAMIGFALDEPQAFVFLELHNHRTYLDAESQAMENRLKDFTGLMLMQAQAQGAVKPGDPVVLMELVFGAFIGIVRAHLDGRTKLNKAAIALAEQACWDAISTDD